jgi:HK97 family phage portal protein
MGLLARLFGSERRSVIPLAGASVGDVEGMRALFGDHLHDAAGQAVAERCRSLISQTTASVPLVVYRRSAGGRTEDRDHPLWRVLNDEASDGVPAFCFREAMARDVARFGNAVAEVVRTGRGDVEGLIHWPWTMVLPEVLPSGRWRYRVTDHLGRQRVLLSGEVVHIRYATRDGFWGVDPLTWARTSTTLVSAQSTLAEAQVRRGFVPDVAFETDRAFDDATGDTAFARLKAQLTERLRRMGSDPTALLLEAGLKAKPLAAPSREQQFHEARVLGLEDIARAYGVPLSVVGLGKNASYGSLTEESRSLARYCLGPWSRLIETQMQIALLTREERTRLSLEHDLSGLMRGDTAEEFKAVQAAVGGPFLSLNEGRDWFGYNPHEGGNGLLRPSNITPPTTGLI